MAERERERVLASFDRRLGYRSIALQDWECVYVSSGQDLQESLGVYDN